MSAEQTFKRWMTLLSSIFFVFFIYIVLADQHAPLTTEARVLSDVIQVSPEVSGNIEQIYVTNNQPVKAGDVLMVIDQRKFKLALEKAELAYLSALEKEDTLYSQRALASANIERALADKQHAEHEYNRVNKLHAKALVSASTLDDAEATYRVAKAQLNAQQQALNVINSQLGKEKGQSAPVLLALNTIEQAKLDVLNTKIIAPSDGIVTNLQVRRGTAAKSGVPFLTFVSTKSMWVGADFREKSLLRLKADSQALITFDAIPGEIFQFRYSDRDYGVANVQQLPNGTLTQVANSNRWVRDAQRTRVHFDSTTQLPNNLIVGSRATVTFYQPDNRFWRLMATIQIRLISWFHFIY